MDYFIELALLDVLDHPDLVDVGVAFVKDERGFVGVISGGFRGHC